SKPFVFNLDPWALNPNQDKMRCFRSVAPERSKRISWNEAADRQLDALQCTVPMVSRLHCTNGFSLAREDIYDSKMLKTRVGSHCMLWVSVGLLLPSVGVAQTLVDSDRDGLSDDTEQVLLEQFRPTFMISATDCAIRPSRFEPNQSIPKPVAVDG